MAVWLLVFTFLCKIAVTVSTSCTCVTYAELSSSVTSCSDITITNSIYFPGEISVSGSSSISIAGSSSSIVLSSNVSRLFNITQNATVSFSSLVLLYVGNDRAIPAYGGLISIDNSDVTLSTITLSGGKAVNGGAISSSNSSLRIYLCNIKKSGGIGTTNGGGIYVHNGGSLHLSDSILFNNTADNGGGLVGMSTSSIIVSNATFTENSAGGVGGAVFLSDVNTVGDFKSSYFNRNYLSATEGSCGVEMTCTTRGGGGAIAIMFAAQLVLDECVLYANHFSSSDDLSYGGAVLCVLSTFEIMSSNISYSYANLGGHVASIGCTGEVSTSSISHLGTNAFTGEIPEGNGIFVDEGGSLDMSHTNISHNRVTESGGALYCGSDCRCDLKSSIIEFNEVEYSGVIYVADNATVDFSSCTFSHNAAWVNGGVLEAIDKSATVNFDACVFEYNSAGNNGGVAVAGSSSVLRFDSSLFRGNTAMSGACIASEVSGEIVVSKSTFTSNYAYLNGGVLFTGLYTNSTFSNCTFTDSVAAYSGGVVYAYGVSQLHISNCVGLRNQAEYSGGVLSLFSGATANLRNSQFMNNSASYGGAILAQYNASISLYLSNCLNNTASTSGGSVAVLDGSTGVLYDSTFADSTSTYNGGAIWISEANLVVDKCSFYNNVALEEGGALDVTYEANVKVRDSTFNNNEAPSGGAVHVSYESSLSTAKCIFADNSASVGGGAMYVFSFAQWSGSGDVFTRNSVADGYGGGVYGSSMVVLHVFNVSFTTHTANSGAAMYCIGATEVEVSNCSFTSNTGYDDGAVSMQDTLFSSFSFVSFTSNSASNGNGGGIHNSLTNNSVIHANMTIDDCTFTHNYAAMSGAAIHAYLGSKDVDSLTCWLNRNIFAFNIAMWRGAAIGAYNAAMSIGSSYFLSNHVELGGGGGVYWLFSELNQVSYQNLGNVFTNNSASYGDDVATSTTRITSTYPANVTEMSGYDIMHPIIITQLDLYDQTVIQKFPTQDLVTASMNDPQTSIILGSSIVPIIFGIANFSEISVTDVPGGSAVVDFTLTLSQSDTVVVLETSQLLEFRACVVGEILYNVTTSTVKCVKCTPGTYTFEEGYVTCKECPENAVCAGGSNVSAVAGYWRSDIYSANMLNCKIPGNCVGGTPVIADQCVEGAEGAFCSVCSSGYSLSATKGTCTSCSSDEFLIELIAFPSSMILFIAICTLIYLKREPIIRRIEQHPWTVRASKFDRRKAVVKLKVIVTFLQITSQLSTVLDVQFPAIYNQYLALFWMFNFDIFQWIDLDCFINRNFYDKLFSVTLGPIILAILIGIGLSVDVCIAYRQNRHNPRNDSRKALKTFIRVCLLLSFFTLAPVSTAIMQTFGCQTFDDGSTMLIADFSIDCEATGRNLYVAYAGLMFCIYPFGIPCVYMYLLVTNHEFLNPNWKKIIKHDERKILSYKVIEREKIKVRNTYECIRNIVFLWEVYRPTRWYFELLECLRRLLLGAIPVVILRGSIFQVVFMLLVSLAYVAIFMRLRPYVIKSDDSVAVISQWIITMTLIVAIILMSGQDASLGLGIILICLNVFVIAFAIFSAIVAGLAPPNEDDMAMLTATKKKNAEEEPASGSDSDDEDLFGDGIELKAYNLEQAHLMASEDSGGGLEHEQYEESNIIDEDDSESEGEEYGETVLNPIALKRQSQLERQTSINDVALRQQSLLSELTKRPSVRQSLAANIEPEKNHGATVKGIQGNNINGNNVTNRHTLDKLNGDKSDSDDSADEY